VQDNGMNVCKHSALRRKGKGSWSCGGTRREQARLGRRGTEGGVTRPSQRGERVGAPCASEDFALWVEEGGKKRPQEALGRTCLSSRLLKRRGKPSRGRGGGEPLGAESIIIRAGTRSDRMPREKVGTD